MALVYAKDLRASQRVEREPMPSARWVTQNSMRIDVQMNASEMRLLLPCLGDDRGANHERLAVPHSSDSKVVIGHSPDEVNAHARLARTCGIGDQDAPAPGEDIEGLRNSLALRGPKMTFLRKVFSAQV